MQAVRDMVQNKRHRLIIGMDDLRNHNLDLARRCHAGRRCLPSLSPFSCVSVAMLGKFLPSWLMRSALACE
jgi:hypothetical protein